MIGQSKLDVSLNNDKNRYLTHPNTKYKYLSVILYIILSSILLAALIVPSIVISLLAFQNSG